MFTRPGIHGSWMVAREYASGGAYQFWSLGQPKVETLGSATMWDRKNPEWFVCYQPPKRNHLPGKIFLVQQLHVYIYILKTYIYIVFFGDGWVGHPLSTSKDREPLLRAKTAGGLGRFQHELINLVPNLLRLHCAHLCTVNGSYLYIWGWVKTLFPWWTSK